MVSKFEPPAPATENGSHIARRFALQHLDRFRATSITHIESDCVCSDCAAEWLCSNANRLGGMGAQSVNSSRRHTATRLVVVCLVVIVGSRSAGADEVELSNGDRITGQVMSLISGMLAFQTPNGQLNVPWVSVTGLAVPEPVFVTVGTRPPTPVTITRTRTDGRVTLRPGGIVSLTEITAMARARLPLGLDGRLNAGLVNTDGNTDANTLRVDGEAIGRYY